jgi:Chlor_Arch_YYY domain
MLDLCVLWLVVELLGIVCLPLTAVVCHNLPDRGWAFSKTVALVWLAFGIWFPLMCIHVLYFGRTIIFVALGSLVAANVVYSYFHRAAYRKYVLWGRQNIWYILSCEVVFVGMVFLLGYIRSYGPQIEGYEMFMNEGLLASIMRSEHFPPNDIWLSGYSINYYYYSLYILAMLGKLLDQTPSIIANTGICMVFGLCASNLFGLACNLVAWARHSRLLTATLTGSRCFQLNLSLPYGYVCLLMTLVFGNLAATQQWWQNHDRVPMDYSLLWQAPAFVIYPRTNISEFPALAFVLSCFHAHVLTLAFTIAALALALNLLLEPVGRALHAFGQGGQLLLTLCTSALFVGGLFAMNGWDFPTYLSLLLLCIFIQQWLVHERHLCGRFIWHCLLACGSLAALAYLFFLPFYLTFVSPAQGIGWVQTDLRSPLSAELLIYGLFIFIFVSLLLVSALKYSRSQAPLHLRVNGDRFQGEYQDKSAITAASIRSARSLLPHYALDDHQVELEPGSSSVAVATVEHEKTVSMLSLRFAWLREKPMLGFWCLGVTVYLLVCFVMMLLAPKSATLVMCSALALSGSGLVIYRLRQRVLSFCLLLGTMAFWLVAMCEVVYLKDDFAESLFARSNTIFKFYFQAWMLLSVACAVGLYFIVDYLRMRFLAWSGKGLWLWWIGTALWGSALTILLLASMVYPLVAPYARYVRLDQNANAYLYRSDSLDGLEYLRGNSDYAAIRWLNAHVVGSPAIVEMLGRDGSVAQRISAFTGLPDIVGSLGHEHLWRVNWLKKIAHPDELAQRAHSLDEIYMNTDPRTVLSLMRYYHARYLYVGALELARYPQSDLSRYRKFMQLVYQRDGVSIYQMP